MVRQLREATGRVINASMPEVKPEFDSLSASYEELLKDPIRDRFTGAAAAVFPRFA